MASKPVTPNLPEGFAPPFKSIVQQKTRHDDVLACIATLTGTTLEDVWKLAIDQNWLPPEGQYWVSEQVIASLVQRLGALRSSNWKDFTSYSALPNVALLWVNPHRSDPEDSGRTIIFHHIPAVPDKFASFSYCIDVSETESQKQIVTDLKRYTPTAFIEITKAAGKGR
jgi:hypothetical protein